MKEKLYNQYKGLIFKVIKDLNCQWQTQDEWQEIFDTGELGLIKAINKVEVDNLKTSYFYKYIRNSILTYYYLKTMPKRCPKLKPISTEIQIGENKYLYEIIPNDINIEEDFIKTEQIKTIRAALNLVKPKYKDILIKYYYQNYDLRKIGVIYNTSYQNIFVLKKNALKQLKKKYKELGGITW